MGRLKRRGSRGSLIVGGLCTEMVDEMVMAMGWNGMGWERERGVYIHDYDFYHINSVLTSGHGSS